MPSRKRKVCLLVNMISPARIPLYSALADHFDLLVLHGGTEANRQTWRDIEKQLPNAKVERAWGWQISRLQGDDGIFIDRRYIHVTPGYFPALVKFRPHVIVSNEMGLRTLTALLYGTVFRVPVWVWWGGTPFTERQIGWSRKALRKIISRWARHWISYGKSSTEYLLSLGVRQESILEIQNMADERRFAVRVEPEFDLRPKPVLLHVGQLVARKGIDFLLLAASALQNEGLQFSLLLVGTGMDEPLFKRLARVLNLKNVHFCSECPPEKMPAIYRSGDVLVFPTIEDVWGLVANEAILSGLPVLCSKYAGCATELFPAKNIFDPRDAEHFKRKLREAVEGRISPPDLSRLRTTLELANDLIRALESSIGGSLGKHRLKARAITPAPSQRTPDENLSSPQQL